MADDQQPIDPSAGQTDEQITESSALPEDPGTPFQPASDPTGATPPDDTHPVTDTQDSGVPEDTQEAYDAGTAAATGAEEPADPGVGSFNPEGEAEEPENPQAA